MAWQDAGNIAVLELATGKQIGLLRTSAPKLSVRPGCIAFSPDGRTVAAGTQAGDILLWDLFGEMPIARLPGHQADVLSVSFSPDGRRLVSGSNDNTMLVWDVSRWTNRGGGKPTTPLAPEEAGKLWDALAKSDPALAYAALGRLAAAPNDAIAGLRLRLKAIPIPTKEIAQLIEELDSNRYADREQAMARLQKIGVDARPALEKVLDGTPNLEVRRRIEALLPKIDSQGLSSGHLQGMRGLELLEMLGTPAAAKLLESLARGEPDRWLTLEAAASLERVKKRGYN